MGDVEFVLVKKLSKMSVTQWMWVAAAVLLIAAVVIWALHYRKAQGKKGVKILAIVAACFLAVVFIAQIVCIFALTKGVDASEVATDDYAFEEGDAEALSVEKVIVSEPKNGTSYGVGERITYRMTVRNEGTEAAENVLFTDYGSYKSWKIERLAPGASIELESGYYVGGDGSVLPGFVGYVLPSLAIASALVLLVSGLFVSLKNREPAEHKTDVRALTHGALCVSIAFVLSYIKLFSTPAGSITLASMLPIMLYANLYGTKRGLLVGLVYGLLQFIQKPEVVHWAQVLLDYPLAFTLIGLSGLSRNLPVGTLIGGFARFVIHVISGFFFYSDVLNGAALWYSITANGVYMLIDTAICFALSFPLAVVVKRTGIAPIRTKPEKKAA